MLDVSSWLGSASQATVDGAVNGASIAVLAVAFQIVYRSTGVFFLALAALYSLAPYLLSALVSADLSWIIAVPLAIVLCGVTAVACEWSVHAPLQRFGAPSTDHLVASFGVYVVLLQAVSALWGSRISTFTHGDPTTWTFGQTSLTDGQLAVILSSVAAMSLAIWLCQLSKTGLLMRVLAENPVALAMIGHRVWLYRWIAFGTAGALAGAAALPVAYELGYTPVGGMRALLVAVAAAVMGGRSLILGPTVAAIGLGVLRAHVSVAASARWEDVSVFVLLAAYLLLRPTESSAAMSRVEAR